MLECKITKTKTSYFWSLSATGMPENRFFGHPSPFGTALSAREKIDIVMRRKNSICAIKSRQKIKRRPFLPLGAARAPEKLFFSQISFFIHRHGLNTPKNLLKRG